MWFVLLALHIVGNLKRLDSARGRIALKLGHALVYAAYDLVVSRQCGRCAGTVGGGDDRSVRKNHVRDGIVVIAEAVSYEAMTLDVTHARLRRCDRSNEVKKFSRCIISGAYDTMRTV